MPPAIDDRLARLVHTAPGQEIGLARRRDGQDDPLRTRLAIPQRDLRVMALREIGGQTLNRESALRVGGVGILARLEPRRSRSIPGPTQTSASGRPDALSRTKPVTVRPRSSLSVKLAP